MPISLHVVIIKYSLVLLSAHRLHILARKDGVVVDGTLLDTDVRLGVCIELLGLVGEVEVERVGPCEGDCFLLALCLYLNGGIAYRR
jgi:hypothetical protein